MMKLPCALLATIAAVCVAAPAVAALGGDATSVESDRARMKGELRVTPGVDYDVHDIQTPSGTVIHEYVSAQGKVFAVWSCDERRHRWLSGRDARRRPGARHPSCSARPVPSPGGRPVASK